MDLAVNQRYPVGIGYARDRQGLGFNRDTWNRGAAIGRGLKNGYNRLSRYLNSGKEKRQARMASRRSRTSRRARRGLQLQDGGGGTTSRFTLKKPHSSKLYKMVAKDFTSSIYTTNVAFRTETADGLQNVAQLQSLYSDTDSTAQMALVLGAVVAGKIFFKNVHAESLIKNQSDVAARIKIYDVIARVDTNATTTDPVTAMTLGFADNSGGAAANYQVVGMTPYANPRFVGFFKILQQTDITLAPGATHNHIINYSPNKLVNRVNISAIAGDDIARLTVTSFIVYYGSPINAVDTQTEVTTSAIALDIVSMEEYHFNYLHQNNANATVTNTLDIALSTAGATMQNDGVELPYNEA